MYRNNTSKSCNKEEVKKHRILSNEELMECLGEESRAFHKNYFEPLENGTLTKELKLEMLIEVGKQIGPSKIRNGLIFELEKEIEADKIFGENSKEITNFLRTIMGEKGLIACQNSVKSGNPKELDDFNFEKFKNLINFDEAEKELEQKMEMVAEQYIEKMEMVAEQYIEKMEMVAEQYIEKMRKKWIRSQRRRSRFQRKKGKRGKRGRFQRKRGRMGRFQRRVL
uniref:Uncharacterized protein n=1 Tax=Mimivirus LCMiAC02 TaxID=2506609 RepID=A0A481Z2A9_9VIRU|nr:MAG: hypothetical protein LCMiAC02_02900 [Mimivirus LCMiAC02]